MKTFKEIFGEYLKGKKVHYKCSCLFPMDVVGVIVDYRVDFNEVIFILESNGKKIEIGENTPKGTVEILS